MNEEQEVLSIVRIGMETQYYLIKGSIKAIMKLLQYFMKLRKEGLLKGGEVEKFKTFLKHTQGQYQILNVPTQDPEKLKQMKENLDMLGVSYTVLPDLNPQDGLTQVAYYTKDTQGMESWFHSFCASNLQGGEKGVMNLMHLTEGKSSIANIPWNKSVEKLQEDLDKLKINYAILPDLNVGDGYTQVMFADADAPKMRSWYELYQNDRLADGTPIGDMETISVEEYADTGKITEEQYENLASDEVKESIQYPEAERKNERTNFEKTLDVKEQRIRDQLSPEYRMRKDNPGLHEIGINVSLVVEPEVKGGVGDTLFISRIPGTFGEDTNYLSLDKSEIFQTDEGKTYLAFLNLEKTYGTFTRGSNGKFHIGPQYTGQELLDSYSKVMPKNKVQSLKPKANPIKTLGK